MGKRAEGEWDSESKLTKLVLLFLHGSYPNALPLTGRLLWREEASPKGTFRLQLSAAGGSLLMLSDFPWGPGPVELAPCRQGSCLPLVDVCPLPPGPLSPLGPTDVRREL